MPKRRCPFEDNCTPQYKVHVTKKEYELTKLETMENVWKKTKELLFEGAKKQMNQNECVVNENLDLCDYCQNPTDSSLINCNRCDGNFCSKCSLTMYNDDMTEYVCLSCV